MCGQRGKVNGSISGYKNPPVPRRLVDSSPHQRILPPGHPVPPRPLPGVGLGSEPPEIGVGTQTGVRVCGLPVQPLTRTGQTDPELLGVNSKESRVYSVYLLSQEVHVSDRPSYSNGKTGAPGQTFFFHYFIVTRKHNFYYTVHNISTGTIHYAYTNTIQDIKNTLDIHKVKKRKENTIHIRQFRSCVPAPSKPSNIFRKDCYSKAHKNLIFHYFFQFCARFLNFLLIYT